MLGRELKVNSKSLIIWSIIMIAFFVIVFCIYPSIMNSENNKMINEMMTVFPQEMLEMFNMDITGIDSVFGWIKTEGYTFLTLIGGVYSAILGATILLKEEGDKTIEFLNSKPISRNKIVTSKIICGIINIAIFTAVISITNYIGLSISNDLVLKDFLVITILPILLYYMLFFASLFISTFLKKTRKGITLGLAITFISYLMQILGGMTDKIEFIKNISFFEFVSIRHYLVNNSLDTKYIIIGIGIIIITTIGTYIRYNKKELI